jgi:phosphoribosylamine--glycine ligase
MTADGPQVLEFNARFGDPETQSYMRLLDSDLLDLIEACIDGRLATVQPKWQPGYAVCVVVASGGYPGKYRRGLPITGLEAAARQPDVVVFHAGTQLGDADCLTAGGRVLNITATGPTLQTALSKAYAAIKLIHFDDMYFRADIGSASLELSRADA